MVEGSLLFLKSSHVDIYFISAYLLDISSQRIFFSKQRDCINYRDYILGK